MKKWFFPSRGFGATEGFSNPGLEMFKGEPIRAMAREVCQNSLDAKKLIMNLCVLNLRDCSLKHLIFRALLK